MSHSGIQDGSPVGICGVRRQQCWRYGRLLEMLYPPQIAKKHIVCLLSL